MRSFIVLILIVASESSSSAQTFEWAYSMGSNATDQGKSIAVDPSGNIYITGTFLDTVDFDPGLGTNYLSSAGGVDIFIMKYDVNGNFLWANSIGGKQDDYSTGITLDYAGNIHIMGYFWGSANFDPGPGNDSLTPAGDDDVFFAKYDSDGNYLWSKAIGGVGWDLGKSIELDEVGNVYVIGFFYGPADFNPSLTDTAILVPVGDNDIFFAKYDSNGNYVWANAIGGSGPDSGHDIAIDDIGNTYVTGWFFDSADFDPGLSAAMLTSNGLGDIFIAKYDSIGDYLWAVSIGGTLLDGGMSIRVDGAGDLYITGGFRDTVDFDPGLGIANLTSLGWDDVFFAKYDSNGNYLWAKSVGSSGSDYSYSIKADSLEHIYLTGYFNMTGDFDPSPTDSTYLTNVGSGDIFLAKYDTDGNYIWAESIGSVGWDEGFDIAIDASGGVYLTGSFSDTADFDPGIDSVNLISVGTGDIFICKFSQCNVVSSFIPSATIACEGDTIGFSNTSTLGTTYQWFNEGILFSTKADTAIVYDTAGVFTISLVTVGTNCSDSSDTMVLVNSLPLTDFTGLDTVYCIDDVLFTDTLTGSPVGGTFSGPGMIGNVFDPFSTGFGTFTITYSFTDGNGCEDSTAQTVEVTNCSSIGEVQSAWNVRVYPNPTTGIFNIEMEGTMDTDPELRIFNSLGQEVAQPSYANDNGKLRSEVDLREYPIGVYTIRILSNSDIITRQIIVE